MNFSFSRILYFIRTLISTIKIPRIKLQKISSTAVTFLEYWKRKNASLAHHWDCMGFQVQFANKHKFQFPLSTPLFKPFGLLFRTKKSVQDQSLQRKLRTWRKTRSQACGSPRSPRQSGAYRLQLMVASCH